MVVVVVQGGGGGGGSSSSSRISSSCSSSRCQSYEDTKCTGHGDDPPSIKHCAITEDSTQPQGMQQAREQQYALTCMYT